MKATAKGASRLYLLNSALLATHEIYSVKELRSADLISRERQARSLIDRQQCSHVVALISYRNADCCQGAN